MMITIIGCESKKETFKKSDLYGTYEANYAGATDKLVIKRDGSYLHVYVVNEKRVAEDGYWSIIDERSGSVSEINVVFNNFKFRPQEGMSSSRGDWFTEAVNLRSKSLLSNSSPRIHLCFQSELQLCFIKSNARYN